MEQEFQKSVDNLKGRVEIQREYFRNYYQQNRDKKLTYQREYREKNKDAINAKRKIKPEDLKRQPRGIVFVDVKDYNKKYHCQVMVEQRLRKK